MIMLHHIQINVLNSVHTCLMLWKVLHIMANSTLINNIGNKLFWHDFKLTSEDYHDNMLI
jgi:hypothetical protein